MKKNQTTAVKRRVGPIPFYDNDGQPLHGLDFKTANGQVFTCSEAADYVAAAGDVVTRSNSYYYEFSQNETNHDSFAAVKLSRPGTTGTSTSVAANTLTNSGAGMTANQYKGQWLIDSASDRYLISSHTTTAFTVAASGATPAAGAYTVEAYKDVEWSERIDGDIAVDSFSVPMLAQLGITLFNAETTGSPVFSSTTFTIAATDSPSPVDDFYIGALVSVYDDSTASKIGAFAVVDDYNGTTRRLTFAEPGLPITPTGATKIALVRGPRVPTADAVRAGWEGDGAVLEGSYRAGDLMRLTVSILAGKVADFQTGTLEFKSLDGAITRWTVTTNPNGRTSVTPGTLTP